MLVFVDLVEARADRARVRAGRWSRSRTATANVSHPVLRDVQQKMADVATVAEENVVGVHVVKSFAQEQAEQDKFERRSETLFDAERAREPAARVLRAAARRSCRCSAQAAVLLVGGHMVANGSMSVARRSSRFNLYLAMLIFPLRMLGMWIGEGQRATASGERIFQVDRRAGGDPRRARARSSCPPGPGRVRFEGVTFGYDPARPVLDGHRPRARSRARRSR